MKLEEVVINVIKGTGISEAMSLNYALLNHFNNFGVRVLMATHFRELFPYIQQDQKDFPDKFDRLSFYKTDLIIDVYIFNWSKERWNCFYI